MDSLFHISDCDSFLFGFRSPVVVSSESVVLLCVGPEGYGVGLEEKVIGWNCNLT